MKRILLENVQAVTIIVTAPGHFCSEEEEEDSMLLRNVGSH
jgi:hypothetical protein